MTYFNTTNKSGEELQQSQRKAMTQNEAVIAALKELGKASASEVHAYLEAKTRLRWLLTSVRRSLSVVAFKTEEKVMGIYGHPEYKYKL